VLGRVVPLGLVVDHEWREPAWPTEIGLQVLDSMLGNGFVRRVIRAVAGPSSRGIAAKAPSLYRMRIPPLHWRVLSALPFLSNVLGFYSWSFRVRSAPTSKRRMTLCEYRFRLQ
jgi:hypothetical protein